jgi:hypothetical protein
LKPVFNVNLIFKYADGTNVLVPEYTDVQLYDEFETVRNWAVNNRVIIRASKTKEIVFRRPKPRMEIAVSPLPGTEQVN